MSCFDDTAFVLPSTDHKVIGKLKLSQPSHVGECHSIHLEFTLKKKHVKVLQIFNTIHICAKFLTVQLPGRSATGDLRK